MTKREMRKLERLVQAIRDLKIEAEAFLAEAQACQEAKDARSDAHALGKRRVA